MEFKTLFDKVSTIFKGTDHWQKMIETVEDSPWHREANVAVHTEMVVAEYVARSPKEWTRADFAGAVACLFHDVGKPASMVMKFKEERGHYKAFHGHEKVSARIFMDMVMSTSALREIFDSVGQDMFFIIGWMIEYHLPWDIKDARKRDMLFFTVFQHLKNPEVFLRVVLSDTYGRISDDAETKRAKSTAWAEQFMHEFESKRDYMSHTFDTDALSKQKTAFVLIGASGSGKSTFKKQMLSQFRGDTEKVKTYSLDDLRHEFYGADYDLAFRKSCADNHFKPKARERFMDMIRDKTTEVLIVDNVHCTKKSRIMYIDELKKRGWYVNAVVFSTSLATVINRQKTRKDKEVPFDAVKRQYDSVELPSIGEVDRIFVEFGE